jgi:hypothetical protein
MDFVDHLSLSLAVAFALLSCSAVQVRSELATAPHEAVAKPLNTDSTPSQVRATISRVESASNLQVQPGEADRSRVVPVLPCPTDAERAQFHLIGQLCPTNPDFGLELCGYDSDHEGCRRVCVDAFIRRPSCSSPMAPLRSRPPDSFAFALWECITRVRDSGGTEPAVCRFPPPLDHMGFGQEHCNARCAQAR